MPSIRGCGVTRETADWASAGAGSVKQQEGGSRGFNECAVTLGWGGSERSLLSPAESAQKTSAAPDNETDNDADENG